MDESAKNIVPAIDIKGLPTGFIDLDSKTSGLQPGDLIIVAARPGMGKTAFAVDVAKNVALKSNLPVAIFSLEMDGAHLAMRMLSSIGKFDAQDFHTGRSNDDDWLRLLFAMGELQKVPIYINDTSELNVSDLSESAQHLHRQCGKLGLIVIDYLQLMSSASLGEKRANEVSEILHSLKNLAESLDVPVMVLSQLSRSPELRQNKRPVISDLRESGAIDLYTDVIMFIYRDEFYNQDTPDKGVAEIIIAKNRCGPVGSIMVNCLKEYAPIASHPVADRF